MESQFKKIKEKLEKKAEIRDEALKLNRDIIAYSKKVIYDVHRGKIEDAERNQKIMSDKLSELRSLIDNEPELTYASTFDITYQEYVEAVCFFA